ncbi:hypothetical protein [Deinococcus multiflagellatus]|uniref:Uncharacterized protein n=1 Tax=Deinococcus multiflagellatus TaxID=1656887 RepID=A0ABW1ZQ27_9DEIO
MTIVALCGGGQIHLEHTVCRRQGARLNQPGPPPENVNRHDVAGWALHLGKRDRWLMKTSGDPHRVMQGMSRLEGVDILASELVDLEIRVKMHGGQRSELEWRTKIGG